VTRITRGQPRTAGSSGEHRYLGELQGIIMEIAWARERVSVRDMHEAVRSTREIAYTTVMTVMARLAAQGVLARERVGRTDYYRPARTREQFRADITGDIVNSLVADFGDLALAEFVDVLARIDPARLARLRPLLDETEVDDARA